MLRLIAIVAGLIFAAKALGSRDRVRTDPAAPRFADGVSEEEMEQEIRAGA